MNYINNAQEYDTDDGDRAGLSEEEVLEKVYAALRARGYEPITQMVGYIISGDPTYITAYHGARILVTKVEQEDLLEEIVSKYFNKKSCGNTADHEVFK